MRRYQLQNCNETCVNSVQWQHALRLLVEIQLNNLQPGVISYTSAISYSATNRYDTVIYCPTSSATVLLSMLVYNDSLLDSISYSCAISVYGKDTQRQHALRLLLEISALICCTTTSATIWLNSDNGSMHADKLQSSEHKGRCPTPWATHLLSSLGKKDKHCRYALGRWWASLVSWFLIASTHSVILEMNMDDICIHPDVKRHRTSHEQKNTQSLWRRLNSHLCVL